MIKVVLKLDLILFTYPISIHRAERVADAGEIGFRSTVQFKRVNIYQVLKSFKKSTKSQIKVG